MTKQDRRIAYTFYVLIILIAGVTLTALFLKALTLGQILLSSVGWNGYIG